MNTNNYKDKYLKYKSKYLQLKEILEGGVNLPQIGLQQHAGECWNDTISTLLLYNNTTGDIIQNIFDTYTIEEIFRIIDENLHSRKIPSCFFPINIEESNESEFNYFVRESKEYIRNLYNRYKNESLEIPELDSNKEIIRVPGKLQRQCSYTESLRTVRTIIELTNLNANIEYSFNLKNKHGGDIDEIEFILSIFNSFLINFDIFNNPTKQIEYLYYKNFVFDNSYFDKIKVINKETILSIMKHIDDTIRLLSGDIYGVYIELTNRKDGEKILGHVHGIFTGDTQTYFYDDNGVDDGTTKHIDKFGQLILPINTYKIFKGKSALTKKFRFIKHLLNLCLKLSKNIHIS
jgi:hypothetical protein